MIQKKICMLGAFAVGKTSLVVRFVKSIFSEKYHTTIGVKIDKKDLRVGDKDLTCILWDLYGEDEFQKAQMLYLRGSSGYLLVVDGTRRQTFETALQLQKTVVATVGNVPFVVVLNKADLQAAWELEEKSIQTLADQGWTFVRTSAKTGLGVEEAFVILGEKTLSYQPSALLGDA